MTHAPHARLLRASFYFIQAEGNRIVFTNPPSSVNENVKSVEGEQVLNYITWHKSVYSLFSVPTNHEVYFKLIVT